jgi:hypothetical protein
MPYVEDKDRVRAAAMPGSVGELTYAITWMLLDYTTEHPRFQDHAEVLGALEAAKLEYYRRVIAPYEDVQRERNGDVY